MNNTNGHGVAALIPAYNEAATIRALAVQALDCANRVFIVDDGSTDGTSQCVEDLPVELLRNERNRGKGHALARGFQAARSAGFTTVVALDGDGQHSPLQIPQLLSAHEARQGALVLGIRQGKRENAPARRRIANDVADFFISWAAGKRISDTQSGFRVYPAAVMDLVLDGGATRDTGFAFEAEVLIAAAMHDIPMATVEIPAVYGANLRRSHYRPVADTCRITARVASVILRRGFNLGGLARAMARA
ncbi:MAG: glycosyltransferase family 2 protein [Ectothiorhodospiraceae bacterium]|jgi:glycosyltransferase involved in cell wall biosynthesis